MQIQRYRSRQYAGIRGREVAFAPGMNVVFGPNESGKSTLLSGIFRTLFLSARLDKRTQKAWIERCFPVDGSHEIDGAVDFCVDGKVFQVEKRWDRARLKNGETVLRDASGAALTGPAAEEKLAALLQHEEAIAATVLFGRQDNEPEVLHWLFAFLDGEAGAKGDSSVTKARASIAAAVQALEASNGFSEERFLQRLDEICADLADRWDVERDRPEGNRGLENPWKTRIGKILEAYYDWQSKKTRREKEETFLEAFSARQRTLQTKKALQKKAASLEARLAQQKRKAALEATCRELREVQTQWPLFEEEERQLSRLLLESEERKRRQEKRRLKGLLAEVDALEQSIQVEKGCLAGKGSIEADSKACRALHSAIQVTEAKWNTLAFRAQIALQAGNTARLETAAGTQTIVEGYDQSIQGYLQVEIPDVAKLVISPQGVDVEALKQELAEKRKQEQEWLQNYGVQTWEELEQEAEKYRESLQKIRELQSKQALLLDGKTREDLQKRLETIVWNPDILVRENLDEAITQQLAGKKQRSLEARLAVITEQIAVLQARFPSLTAVRERLREAEWALLETTKSAFQPGGHVPGDATPVEEERELMQFLQDDAKIRLAQEIERESYELARASVRAEQMDFQALQTAERAAEKGFQREKKRLQQYRKIRADFLRLREDPEGLYEPFYQMLNGYLEDLTGDISIPSQKQVVRKGTLPLEAEHLSRGTEQAILLAFRLTVIRHFFPRGGGLLVLDDALSDLDENRREKAVAFLTDFAQDNQILFTTCSQAMADLLGGTRIEIQ